MHHNPRNCNNCRENDSHRQLKAGCGHVIHLCSDCEGEVNRIQHNKCRGCKVAAGGKSPEDILREDQALFDEYQYPDYTYDRDDFYLDRFEPAHDQDDALDIPDSEPFDY